MNIERNENRILLKYVDSKFNCYKCTIPDTDVFLVNFCKNNLQKMERILKNYKIIEMSDHYILKVEDPVDLEYVLKKDTLPSMENLLSELERLREDNKIFSSKISEQTEIISKMEKISLEKEQEMQKRLESVLDKYSDLNKKMEIVSNETGKKIKSYQGEISSLKGEISSLKNKLTEKENQIKVLSQKIQENYINGSSYPPPPSSNNYLSSSVIDVVWHYGEGKYVHYIPGQHSCSSEIKKGIWSETTKSYVPL